ncbi:hypothetical protein FGF04_36870 [Streptomyces apricus]|uniref:Uncharacterized protein n=1 Tax=Streptomyces apricus TaxID=1828112 RepID=A0A5A9ZVW4_9ACTN|nr:hypothetical protein FGF04_36870 [Streptomyces apricus]
MPHRGDRAGARSPDSQRPGSGRHRSLCVCLAASDGRCSGGLSGRVRLHLSGSIHDLRSYNLNDTTRSLRINNNDCG